LTHGEHKIPLQCVTRWARDAYLDRAVAGGDRRDRDGNRTSLLGAQRNLLRRTGAGDHRIRGRRGQRVVAGLTLDIVEIEMKRGAVAGKQKARQGRGQYDRIADSDIGRSLADFVLAPGHRHDSQCAGEIRNVERNIGGAVLADGDETREQCHRRSGWRTALQLRAFVAAAADLAACALHAVDQVAVEVADIGRQRALAEIVIAG
jgi:hypothetical protein